MKKIIILLPLLIIIFILSGCGKKQTTLNLSNDANLDSQKQLENSDANCFTVCHQKIQDVCLEQIIEIGPEELIGTGSLLDPASCEASCAANFTDDTLNCFTKITSCDQVMGGNPYCKETEIPDSDIYEEDEFITRTGCQIPCEKYKKCAGYGTDATTEDMQAAYDSCMEVCQDWSDKTINCINQKNINTAADCANMTACALQEYQGLIQ